MEFLGKPNVPIQTIYLRLSTPVDPASNLNRNFQLTELVDESQGVFAIYLRHRPSDYSFFGQLAHEVGHLLDAQVYDAYIEGANTAFAELFLKKKRLDWKGWHQYFQSGKDPFYGATYFMMKEVFAIGGSEGTKTLLLHSKWTDPKYDGLYLEVRNCRRAWFELIS